MSSHLFHRPFVALAAEAVRCWRAASNSSLRLPRNPVEAPSLTVAAPSVPVSRTERDNCPDSRDDGDRRLQRRRRNSRPPRPVRCRGR